MGRNKFTFKVKIIWPNLDKSLIGLTHYGTRFSHHVASNEGDAISVLIVTVGVRSLLIPATTLIDESVPTNRETVANVIPVL